MPLLKSLTTHFLHQWRLWAFMLPITVVLEPWSLSAPAHGQVAATNTPTVTPTVTPTPSPIPAPSAKSVLAAARKRLRSAGSAHIIATGSASETAASVKSASVSLTAKVDVSLRQHHLHTIQRTIGSLTPGMGAASERQEVIGVGRWTAQRTNNGPWSCNRAATLSNSTYDPAQLMTHLKQPFTIAASVLNGEAVWHVTAKYSDASTSETGHATYDIAQSDDTLIQGSITLKAVNPGFSTIHFALTFTVSRLGERVKAKIPGSCHRGVVSVALALNWSNLRPRRFL